MLGADLLLPARQRLPERELKHTLRERGERQHPRVACVRAGAQPLAHLFTQRAARHPELREDLRDDPAIHVGEREHEVLGSDRSMTQRPRFLLRASNDLAGLLGEALEHSQSMPPPQRSHKPLSRQVQSSLSSRSASRQTVHAASRSSIERSASEDAFRTAKRRRTFGEVHLNRQRSPNTAWSGDTPAAALTPTGNRPVDG